jgi:trimethylguanosine synthase
MNNPNGNGSEKKVPAFSGSPLPPLPAGFALAGSPAAGYNHRNVADNGSGDGNDKRQRQPTPSNHFPPGSPQTPPAKRDPRNNNRNSHHNRPQFSNSRQSKNPDMSVLVSRADLYDSGHRDDGSAHAAAAAPQPPPSVGSYAFEPPKPGHNSPGSVAVCRMPLQTYSAGTRNARNAHTGQTTAEQWAKFPVMDRSVPNPHHNPKLDKYWNQRRRLFSRFDQGVQLDEEGWYSVTPEQIADHVASRLTDLAAGQGGQGQGQGPGPGGPNNNSNNNNIVVLDAFCGCGGNAIAFAKQPGISVIGVDLDRSKLRRAAHNAALYDIPPSKLVFIECNVLFILEHCFRNGIFVLDQPLTTPEAAERLMASMPPPVPTECLFGYNIGGFDLLPNKIDAVFLDPPWGGVDYEVFGKTGYDLAKNMRIQRPKQPVAPVAPNATAGCSDGLDGSFFDSFQSTPRNKQEKKAQFNSSVDESNCVNGSELLAIAAAATSTHWVLYDVPRNTNRISLGQSALAAGYQGNCKLEEHYLNGRLKTVTAYFGSDWSSNVAPSAGGGTNGDDGGDSIMS